MDSSKSSSSKASAPVCSYLEFKDVMPTITPLSKKNPPCSPIERTSVPAIESHDLIFTCSHLSMCPIHAMSPAFSRLIFGGSQFQGQSADTFDAAVELARIKEDFAARKARRQLAHNGLASSPGEKPRRAVVNEEDDRRNPGEALANIEAIALLLEDSNEQDCLSDLGDVNSLLSPGSGSTGTSGPTYFTTNGVSYRPFDGLNETSTVSNLAGRTQRPQPQEESHFERNIKVFLGMLFCLALFTFWFYQATKGH